MSSAQNILNSVLRSIGSQLSSASQTNSQIGLENQQTVPNSSIKFCKFSKIYARDLLEMINTNQSLSILQQNQNDQRVPNKQNSSFQNFQDLLSPNQNELRQYQQNMVNNETLQYKQYYEDLLLKQNEILYPEIIEQIEKEQKHLVQCQQKIKNLWEQAKINNKKNNSEIQFNFSQNESSNEINQQIIKKNKFLQNMDYFDQNQFNSIEQINTAQSSSENLKINDFNLLSSINLAQEIITAEEQNNSHLQKISDIKRFWLNKNKQKVQCLLISTGISLEIWVLNNQISVKFSQLQNRVSEIDCLFRKLECDVTFFDFIYTHDLNVAKHLSQKAPNGMQISQIYSESQEGQLSLINLNDIINQSKDSQLNQFMKLQDGSSIIINNNRKISFDSNSSGMNTSDDSSYAGVYENHLPLIGYVRATSPANLAIYSLKNQTAINVWRFGSSIIKFSTNIQNPNNKAIVLLSEGLLQIINLKSMSTEVSLPTYFITKEINEKRKIGINQLSEPMIQLEFIQSLPKYFDMSQEHYAYVYSTINHQNQMIPLQKMMDDSMLGQNIYTKDIAEKAVNFGQQVKQKVDNLFNVQKAVNIDINMLQEHLNKQRESGSQSKGQGMSNLLIMMGFAHGGEISQLNNEEYFQDYDFTRNTQVFQNMYNQNEGMFAQNQDFLQKKLLNLQMNSSKIIKENKILVQIRDLKTHSLFVEIEPPFFQSISVIKFSPSGRFILIGNENCQCFYIYEIMPASCLRVNGIEGGPNSTNMAIGIYPKSLRETVRLQYSLFRGNTSAKITDVQFVNESNCQTDLEQILIINSSNGTSHVFNLSKNQRQNKSPIIKNDQLNKELIKRIGISQNDQQKAVNGSINIKNKAWLQFMQQQLEHLNVVNLESICKIKYSSSSQSQGQVFTNTNEGVIDQIYKGAQGLGLASQQPELCHLVTTIRQEWDVNNQTFQYQLQSYTGNNEYFIINLGTHIENNKESENRNENKANQNNQNISSFSFPNSQYGMKWQFKQPAFNLNICQNHFVPVLNQAQVLETIKSCGQFMNLPIGRKRSSINQKEIKKEDKHKEYLQFFEHESFYPKIMLEQRMNQNIAFRIAKKEFIKLNESEEDNDFNWNIESQLKKMTSQKISELDKQKQQNIYQLQNQSLYDVFGVPQQDSLLSSTLSSQSRIVDHYMDNINNEEVSQIYQANFNKNKDQGSISISAYLKQDHFQKHDDDFSFDNLQASQNNNYQGQKQQPQISKAQAMLVEDNFDNLAISQAYNHNIQIQQNDFKNPYAIADQILNKNTDQNNLIIQDYLGFKQQQSKMLEKTLKNQEDKNQNILSKSKYDNRNVIYSLSSQTKEQKIDKVYEVLNQMESQEKQIKHISGRNNLKQDFDFINKNMN